MAAFSQPVTLVTRVKGAPDAFGNDTWTQTTTVVRGLLAPGSSVEQVQGQDTLTVQPTVYLPAGTDVSAVDALVIAGDTYEVDGSPNAWTSPITGRSPGVEVKLRRATG